MKLDSVLYDSLKKKSASINTSEYGIIRLRYSTVQKSRASPRFIFYFNPAFKFWFKLLEEVKRAVQQRVSAVICKTSWGLCRGLGMNFRKGWGELVKIEGIMNVEMCCQP